LHLSDFRSQFSKFQMQSNSKILLDCHYPEKPSILYGHFFLFIVEGVVLQEGGLQHKHCIIFVIQKV
jgi:hypothetical protein